MEVLAPVIHEVDILIIGGTLPGCELALRLRKAGRRILIVSEDTALGTDVAGSLDREKAQKSPILQECLTPAAVVAALDRSLLENGVDFLLGVMPLRPLLASGSRALSGWLFFGRSGYFGIAAKAVVDATREGHLPYQARLARRSTALAECCVRQNIVGCLDQQKIAAGELRVEVSLEPIRLDDNTTAPLCRVRRNFRLCENDMPAKLRAETILRSALEGDEGVQARWCSFSFAGVSPWNGVATTLSFQLYRAETLDIARLLQNTLPGREIAKSFLPVESRHVLPDGEELLWKCKYPRSGHFARVGFALESLATNAAPVDLVVLGGGIAGCQAAVAAAKRGLKVLLAEANDRTTLPLAKLLGSGVEVWHHMLPGGTLMQRRSLCGVLLIAATGESVLVRTKAVIDATGYAVAAAAAGAPIQHPLAPEPVTHGAVVAPRMHPSPFGVLKLHSHTGIDTMDATRSSVLEHLLHSKSFSAPRSEPLCGHPRILGEVSILPHDVVLQHHFPDTIAVVEGHYPELRNSCHPLFWMTDLCEKPTRIHLPLRAFLPLHIDGMLVPGQAISAHKDVLSICDTREAHAQEGYAAGTAVALAIKKGTTLRQLPIREVQALLVAEGRLPEDVLATDDSEELPPSEEGAPRLAEIFRRPDQARRVLQAEYESTHNLDTAMILAFLGDSSGRDTLTSAMRKMDPAATPRPFCLLLSALAVIGGSPACALEKLPLLTPDSSVPILRTIANFFQRWPCREAAGDLRRCLDAFLERLPQPGGLTDVLYEVDDEAELLGIKALYLATALHNCAPDDVVARAHLEKCASSWRFPVAQLASQALHI